MSYPNLKQAQKLAPIVDKVHGEHHPELRDVRELTSQLKPGSTANAEILEQLRNVTHEFELPADGCEGYAMLYDSLSKVGAELED